MSSSRHANCNRRASLGFTHDRYWTSCPNGMDKLLILCFFWNKQFAFHIILWDYGYYLVDGKLSASIYSASSEQKFLEKSCTITITFFYCVSLKKKKRLMIRKIIVFRYNKIFSWNKEMIWNNAGGVKKN